MDARLNFLPPELAQSATFSRELEFIRHQDWLLCRDTLNGLRHHADCAAGTTLRADSAALAIIGSERSTSRPSQAQRRRNRLPASRILSAGSQISL